MKKPPITCRCGCRIVSRDIVHRSSFMRTRGDAYVYLRYRCHHCRKLGERYIPIEEWNPRSLNWTEPEMTAEEEQRFAGLGPITEAEIRSMRKALSTLRRIPHNDDSP